MTLPTTQQYSAIPVDGQPQGRRMSVREQGKRLSQLASPLGDLIDLNRASTYSWDEAQFVTAAPNTPFSVSFPDTSSPPTTLESATIAERTPKSSISSQSDTTAVASPGSETRKAVLGDKDIEASSEGRALRGANAPWPLRRRFSVILVVSMLACAVTLVVLPFTGKGKAGWDAPVLIKFAQASGWSHLLFTIPPTIVAMLISALWCWTDAEVRRLQPLLNLASGPVISERSLTLDYSNVFVAFFMTLKWGRDVLVTLSTLCAILSMALQPLSGALFTVREVWWVQPATTVSSIKRVGLNQAANFLDMTSFQAASSFASADVMYNISSPPFVSGGYTVAEFELPDVVNGTVYTNRSAVLNQASCVAPDSIAQTNEINAPLIWHNTALFGHCEYKWTVESNATYLYGLAPGNFVGCGQDLESVPVQYRPVLFWFFKYGEQPRASMVLCTPHATSLQVSVAIDVAARTTDVMPLPTSPDDTSIADIGSFAYNGIFFDESALDETALARLQAIQQQLPGAIFEAARNKDPFLMQTFINYGFTALTRDIYTTYLSLVAKSVYFVDDDEKAQVSVSVGTICSRLFLVPLAACLLSLVLLLLFLGGTALHVFHFQARRDLVIPPHFGTLSAAIWLAAQTDLMRSLAEDSVGPEKIGSVLSGLHFYIDKRVWRIFSVPDDRPRKGHWMGRCVARLRRMTAALFSRKTVVVGEPAILSV